MKSALKTIFSSDPKTNFDSYVEKCLPILKNISKQKLTTQGTTLHGHLLKKGVSKERYIAIKLLIMYLTSMKSVEANEILKEFNGFDLIAHNCLINAYVQWGNLNEARKLFDEMPERNEISWTALISGFMKHGRVEESIRYFERNPFNNVFSWTAAISGFVQNGYTFEALKLFLKLLKSGVDPNEVTFTSIVRACAILGNYGLGMSVVGLIVKAGFDENVSVCNSLITLFLKMGEVDLARRVFDRMKKRDIVSWTALLDVYVEMGDLEEARRIFDEMPERSEISWSAIIARYTQSGYPKEALKLFSQMVGEGFKPNTSCFATILSALAGLENLKHGMNVHAYVVKMGVDKDVFIGSSLIDLYCKCGKINDGRLVFDSILEKNVVSWNSMIGGYSLNGLMDEARGLFDNMPVWNTVSWNSMIIGHLEHKHFDKVFEVFNEMLLSGEIPNKSTFSSVLCASANLASLEKGKNIHGKLVKLGFPYDLFPGTALTDMYAKCGDIESSKRVFDRMLVKNEISWTVMIQGLAESGFAKESLDLFEKMDKNSIPPNELMMLSVLFACSHSGLVDRGIEYFKSMETVYNMKPRGRHYTCVIDMLSRSGRLNEAEDFINSMPSQFESNAWAALLSGCVKYKNEEIAERVVNKLWTIAEKNSAAYVLLSNMYAAAGRWSDVMNIRKLMKEKGLKKSAGCSRVEVRNEVHCFYSEDGTYSRLDELYGVLELLRSEMIVCEKMSMIR